MAKSTNYDGILMDCQMPVMDGYEATKMIRENSNFNDVPILALSANAMDTDRQRSLESGMNDHISKPIDVRNLFETMAKWITPKHKEETPVPPVLATHTSLEQPIAISGLDLQSALERAGDDRDFLKKMLRRFAQTQGKWCTLIDTLLAEQKIEDARRETHTLKGLAGNIGAIALFNLTKEIEEKLKNNEIEEAKLLLPLAKEELAQVIKNIEEFFTHEITTQKRQQHHTLSPQEIEMLKHDIKELMDLLEECDVDAIALAEKIAPQLEDLSFKTQADALMAHINAYDFDAAKEILLECTI